MTENIDDTISKNFILSPCETNAVNLLRYLRTNNLFHITILLSEYFENIFPYSTDIKDECSISYYYSNNHYKSYDVHEKCLNMRGLNQNIAWRMLFNQHFSINNVADRFIFYNKDIVNYIINKPIKDFPLVTLTITTCKRFDLFEKTMNSLLNCVDIDNIDYWFCVDDNSSIEDRDKMKSLYPFFNFYLKDIEEKGHPQSMNIIKNNVKTPYIFHLEDDWKFFVKRNYIKDAIEVIESNKSIGQCLFNKNYSEIESDIDIKGGVFSLTNSGFRYFIHEYCKNDEEIKKWTSKYGNCKSSSYWPHWSLRPSVFKTSIFNDLGDFDEKVSHFEMNYAHRYTSKGFVSAFFEGIYCLHTGRLTSERDDQTKLNAYKLNNEVQFYGKEELFVKFKTFVVNLDRRNDRWESFMKNADSSIKFLNYERFSAVDGKGIKNSCQLQQIFENNDYSMRRGMIGCLLSHVKLYTDLINSDYEYFVILEDDIEFTPNFEDKYNNVLSQLSDKSWDFLFLGHHIKDKNKQIDELNKDKTPIITKRNAYWSFLNSLGGTGGYIIKKQGAIKLLDFINKSGSTNGIDTLIQKSANELDIYYTNPHLIFTDCYRGNNNLDTDIQFDYSNDLVLSLEQRLQNELNFFDNNINLISDLDKAKELSSDKYNKDSVYFISTNNVDDIIECCVHPYYTLENKIIFIIPDTTNVNRYFHRFKKFDNYDISDVM